ncbi:MAG: M48 family metallopeptidase [Xanthomonadaceae bacterium]|nr:M48 family metallopeptidase [Xanthomonadaceae bacterium]
MVIAGISVEVLRKDIKNLHVGVYPPAGRVRVAAPLLLDDEAVRLAVISRLGWIRRQQAAFHQQERQSPREYVSGESHYFRGRRYRIEVVERRGPASIAFRNNTVLTMHAPPGADAERRAELLDLWYRNQLRAEIPGLLHKWLPKVGVLAPDVRIKKLKTLWGSCNPEAGRVWLNLELIKKPYSCLEFILVHELVHLIERHHNERFLAIMDRVMPSWRSYREDLNRAPLAHSEWDY